MLQRLAAALRRECLWSRPIKGAMGSFVIVLLEPVGDDATGLLHGGKQPAIETPIAQDPVQAFEMNGVGLLHERADGLKHIEEIGLFAASIVKNTSLVRRSNQQRHPS